MINFIRENKDLLVIFSSILQVLCIIGIVYFLFLKNKKRKYTSSVIKFGNGQPNRNGDVYSEQLLTLYGDNVGIGNQENTSMGTATNNNYFSFSNTTENMYVDPQNNGQIEVVGLRGVEGIRGETGLTGSTGLNSDDKQIQEDVPLKGETLKNNKMRFISK